MAASSFCILKEEESIEVTFSQAVSRNPIKTDLSFPEHFVVVNNANLLICCYVPRKDDGVEGASPGHRHSLLYYHCIFKFKLSSREGSRLPVNNNVHDNR
ncbi:hypothetical protein J6590_014680 [Homalodisca vitripennis]|nr:hypothetical protein J6590_014680 [Homalodisca vitripennis]